MQTRIDANQPRSTAVNHKNKFRPKINGRSISVDLGRSLSIRVDLGRGFNCVVVDVFAMCGGDFAVF